MAVYLVQGKLGTGKSKFCVWLIQQAIREGRRVAGNLDLHQHLLVPSIPTGYIRLPDKPTAFDFDAIGHGNPGSYDEMDNGVLVLDELGTWLNSRNFQDKERGNTIDWLIHARKKGWDVLLIVQDAMMIDKQVRDALVEYTCNCMRMDRVKIPFLGFLLVQVRDLVQGLTGNFRIGRRWGYLPFFHLVTARVGQGPNAVVAERWSYIGSDLHAAYDTRQIFRTDYPHGAHSVLPPWDWKKPVPSWFGRLLLALFSRDAIGKLRSPKLPHGHAIPKPSLSPELQRVKDLCMKLPPSEAWNLYARYVRSLQRKEQLAISWGQTRGPQVAE